ncbi:MAG: sigma-70 family RNA polymerase sigma factor [Spirochaetes bacterium]|jgi:RNA polymerase sigma-70 factor (ECF subfamily)|nr:sigma-70 family RNA polymerase sigma factor [Spirochaetota bacterium]
MSAEAVRSETDDRDREVIRAVLDGDTDAFRELVDRYQAPVRALGYRFLRNDDAVEDYIQDVYLKAFTRLHTYRGNGRFYSWLMRIAYTTACNLRNRSLPEDATDPGYIAEVELHPDADPEHQYVRARARKIIDGAIAELPKKYAIAVELFFKLQLSYREIVSITGVTLNTLKSHVYRARKLLKKAIAGTEAEDMYAMQKSHRAPFSTG